MTYRIYLLRQFWRYLWARTLIGLGLGRTHHLVFAAEFDAACERINRERKIPNSEHPNR